MTESNSPPKRWFSTAYLDENFEVVGRPAVLSFSREETRFLRGDSNADTSLDLADALRTLGVLFRDECNSVQDVPAHVDTYRGLCHVPTRVCLDMCACTEALNTYFLQSNLCVPLHSHTHTLTPHHKVTRVHWIRSQGQTHSSSLSLSLSLFQNEQEH